MGLSKDDVPVPVENSIMHHHGEAEGGEWLQRAVEKVSELESDWHFNTLEVLGGRESLLIKVEDADRDSVLKIPSDSQAGCDEIAALKIWEDCNVPTVLNEDTETGVFMMDFIPAVDKQVSPFQAFVFADVMHTPESNFEYKFPSLLDKVSERMEFVLSKKQALSSSETENLELAKRIVEALLTTQDHKELLHGDYRNGNIIYSENGPIIVDPQPCIGDSLFDIALWLSGTSRYQDIEVVLELVGGSAYRLAPWIWSLSVLNHGNLSLKMPSAADNLKDQSVKWLEDQG